MHTFKDTPEIAHELTLGVLLASRIEPTRPSQKVYFLASQCRVAGSRV